jgi:uroporphyrinogen decarboxylase
MNSRERVLTTLDHREPDRLPVDLGGRQTTFMVGTYEKFKTYLGLDHLPIRLMSKIWQTVFVDENVLERLEIDCRHIRPLNKLEMGSEEVRDTADIDDPDGEEIFEDQWGIVRRIEGGYASIIGHPLQKATLEDLENYAWPDPALDYDYGGIREQAQRLREANQYAIVGCMGSAGNLFEQSWYLRGMPEFLLDMVSNKDFAHALLSRILEIRKKNAEVFLSEVGEYLDVFQLADDLAMQSGPLMSPQMYREMIKPYQVELFQHAKKFTRAKIYFHSCGSVSQLLDDLIEVGVDILNPVQVSARGMEADQLKKRYGRALSFWGAVDTSEVLPNGTVKDVRSAVIKLIRDLGPSGGYVLASVHNMQPDIPPENIEAMYKAARKFGKYPIV